MVLLLLETLVVFPLLVTGGDATVLARFKLLLFAAIGISFFLLPVRRAILSQVGRVWD